MTQVEQARAYFPKTGKREENLEWAIRYIRGLTQARYFGKITISLEDGCITFLRDERTLRPEP